jgi:hypothetical protein
VALRTVVAIGVGLAGLLGIVFVVERCYDNRRLAGPGSASGGVVVRNGTTTTVVVVDSISRNSRGWKTRITSVDGTTGTRLATKVVRSASCLVNGGERLGCSLDGRDHVRLDPRTLELVDGPAAQGRWGPASPDRRCAASETVWFEGASWGFSRSTRQIFAQLPLPAEGAFERHTTFVAGNVLTEVWPESGPLRIGDDFLVQHRRDDTRDAAYLMSRVGRDGRARWTVPLASECNALHLEAERLIVLTSGPEERAIGIDPRTGIVMWRLQY